MDALSSKMFKPIQPDEYVLSSLGKDTPKIEITETDSLCQGPLSPTGCDVPLCEWDDLHHHGDSAGQGDCLVEQSANHHHHDSSDHRRGSLSRRSEGGPGKCPSPSRNSPRRHSPVPYSPKRQNRTRSSASSAASEEFPDVSLSPRRHSPVPGSPHAERPSSLSLASGSAEEFICVSYTDPFSSPTITHTSEAILAISINCSHDHGDDQDVEMTPQDARSDDPGSVVDSADILPSCPSTSIASTSVNDESLQGSSWKNVSESQPTNSRDLSNMSVIEAGNKTSAFVESAKSVDDGSQTVVVSDPAVLDMNCQIGTKAVESKSTCSNKGTDEGLQGMELMEGEDDFHVDEVTDSDSSSDEEMIEFVSPSYDVSMSMSSGCAIPKFRSSNSVAFDTQLSSLAERSQNKRYEPSHSSCDPGSYRYEQADGTVITTTTSFGSTNFVSTQATAVDLDRNQSNQGEVDHSTVQSLPNELSRPPYGGKGSWTARRASCPDQHAGLHSSPLSPCSSKEASPRRSLSQHVSKTPEDFALSCVVGSPPLTFPHCQYAVLVHCSLPSPYDPDLPTPPIVLTPHTSYEDLNFDPISYDAPVVQGATANVRTFSKGSSGENKDVPLQRPDISRSRSFPKLNQDDDQFQEPDQAWPVLGEVQARESSDMSADEQKEPRRQWESRRSSDSSFVRAEVGDMGDLSKGATSVSLPGSPSNSRAAVIGRLRRVVERRLSGTSDSMEAALREGESP